MKNFKILRINGVFHDLLTKNFIKKNINFNSLSYNEALKSYEKNSYFYSFSFTKELEKFGNKAIEILADFKELQIKWAKEHKFKFDEKNWAGEILFEQIRIYRPDIIFFQSHHFLNIERLFYKKTSNNTVQELKKEFNFIKKVIVYSGFPCDSKLLKETDLILYSPPSTKRFYKKAVPKAILMYHSFDPNILKKINNKEKFFDLTFMGSSRYPETRYFYLKHLMENHHIISWINENTKKTHNLNEKNIKTELKRFFIYNLTFLSHHTIDWLRTIGIYNIKYHNIINLVKIKKIKKNDKASSTLKTLFPNNCKPPIYGMDYYNKLYQSKISLNFHADKAYGCVGNMRMFETTGVGTCLLTDNGSNLSDLFEDGKEVVTFRTIEEAKTKIKFLLENPKTIKKIALAGQKKTLSHHTIKNRCEIINELINNET